MDKEMDMDMDKRYAINITKLIEYIQQNYRQNLNGIDYEIIQNIADTYKSQEVMDALMYCKKQGSNSLKYLQDALSKKYYQNERACIIPKWLDEELKVEPLDTEDKAWCRNFYYKYCDTKEEAESKIKKLGLEE